MPFIFSYFLPHHVAVNKAKCHCGVSKKSEYGGPVLVLNGEETDYGGILEVLVPGQEEYEDEYMKVSKIQQFFQFLQEISTLCVCSMH